MNNNESFDFSSDEYNYIDDNENDYQSDNDEIENFIINDIYDSTIVEKYENILYEELDAKKDSLFSDMYQIDCILNKKNKEKEKEEILKKFYTIIKNSINKFNNIKKIANNNYIIIPIINEYNFYTGINCYITNNISEIETIVNKILDSFTIINIHIDNYNLKEINESTITESIMDKNKKLEINMMELKEDIRIFTLDINFID